MLNEIYSAVGRELSVGETAYCIFNNLAKDYARSLVALENATGEKSLRFGFGHNVFMPFPEEGYSDLTANVRADGNFYASAISADWCKEKALRLRVQIIDKYFGNLAIIFGFKNENEASVRMSKTAEDFLGEYNGVMNAERKV